MSTSDESQMFSLSALTQNSSAQSAPTTATRAKVDDDDSGVIDLARLTSGFDPSLALPPPDPPLFMPQPLAPPSAQQNAPRRSAWLVLSAAASVVAVTLALVFWWSDEPAPVPPAPETAVPRAAQVNAPSQPASREVSASSATPPAELERTEPVNEESELSAPAATLPKLPKIPARPPVKRRAPVAQAKQDARAKPPKAAQPKQRRDPCAHCAAGDLRCNMQCRAH